MTHNEERVKKYIVYPGYVDSKSDNDRHFITARQLINLYGVNPKECIVWDYDRPMMMSPEEKDNYISLVPLFNGNYKEHLEKGEMYLRTKDKNWPFIDRKDSK